METPHLTGPISGAETSREMMTAKEIAEEEEAGGLEGEDLAGGALEEEGVSGMVEETSGEVIGEAEVGGEAEEVLEIKNLEVKLPVQIPKRPSLIDVKSSRKNFSVCMRI